MRILLVDDSALVRGIVKQALEGAGFEIVGQASNGAKAVEMTVELNPDLVIMDINMPVMDGLAATRSIMKLAPTPILIFSTEFGAKIGFEAVSSGAMDIMHKPDLVDFNDATFFENFQQKITALGSRKQRRRSSIEIAVQRGAPAAGQGYKIVVMGASTGGPLAVREVLHALPDDFPLGIALVQHLEEGFDQGYADWLNENTRLTVRLAKKVDSFQPGEVVVSPVGKHLLCEDGALRLTDSPKVLNQKPAVDVLFKSAAASYGDRALAVLLTGMGRDGAEGCAEIRRRGGYTVVQDEESSAIFGMPKVAIELNGASEVKPLIEIGHRLIALTKSRQP